MTRTEFFTMLDMYRQYVQEHNEQIYSKPVKGVSVNYGANGYSYEGQVKAYLGYTRSNLGTTANTADNRTDLNVAGLALEIKHHCGQIEMFFSGKKIDYVAYCPEFIDGMDVNRCTYVLSKNGFLSVLDRAGLIRLKKGTDGIVRHAIQSYKNSVKRYNLFLDLLDEYNLMTLEQYKALLEQRKAERKASRR